MPQVVFALFIWCHGIDACMTAPWWKMSSVRKKSTKAKVVVGLSVQHVWVKLAQLKQQLAHPQMEKEHP